ncbi:MAG: hypothetical protein E7523_05630 [Ruminococcaceae bacterium]|nr:hypothetical protein [Oscillospiraceae bacterium]
MIKTVSQTTIADVFSISSDKVYKIPKYQREYTWGIKEWDGLFNRDYLIITEEEAQEKIEIDKANTDYSDRRFPVMKGCFLQYPKAVRHLMQQMHCLNMKK